MNTARLLLLLSALIVSALRVPPSAFAQGPLTPPGAPAPTMKTLDQIEARTDVLTLAGDADYHHIITQAGSYYLSGNLFVTKPNGIYVRLVEGVTIDLNGFEIRRTSGNGGDGITITAVSHRCVVRNGSIKGFAHGIQSLLSGNFARACAFRDLSVSSCTSHGIFAGEGAVVEACRAHDNSGTAGIRAEHGSILVNCAISNNTTLYGIWAEFGCSLTNCSAYNNIGSSGIFASAGPSLINCTASNNTAQYGILTSSGASLTNCSAFGNQSSNATSAGIGTGGACTIAHCTAYSNTSTAGSLTPATGMGFDVGVGSTIQGCTAGLNQGDGISILSDTAARDNTCDSNGLAGNGAGIHAKGTENRIDGNNVSNNDRGIDLDDVRNFVIRNSARDNAGMNYVIVAGNRVGAIVVPPLSGDIAGDTDSDAAGVGTTDPWANFTY